MYHCVEWLGITGPKIAATHAGNLFGGNLRASFRVRRNTVGSAAPPGILMDVLEQRNDNARVCQIESGLLTQASCLQSNGMDLLQYEL
ncbi:hypothetical protein ANTPLA_LOCUS8127 [Anthophora plagiata]